MGIPGMMAAATVVLLAGAPGDSKETHTLQDALQICARIQNPTDRLACFEGLAKSTGPEATANGSPGTDQAAAPRTPSSATGQGAAGARTASERRVANKAAARTASEQRRAVKARQRQAKAEGDGDREGYDAVVMRAWAYQGGEQYVALTNGEIWKSEGQDFGRPIRDGEAVELHPGFAGSWFLQFKSVKRPGIRVKLVE